VVVVLTVDGEGKKKGKKKERSSHTKEGSNWGAKETQQRKKH
jgi:hypothetical protein